MLLKLNSCVELISDQGHVSRLIECFTWCFSLGIFFFHFLLEV